jgi:hypothetical protein
VQRGKNELNFFNPDKDYKIQTPVISIVSGAISLVRNNKHRIKFFIP